MSIVLKDKCQENRIETVFDLVEMKDDEKRVLLQMSDFQLRHISRFCNRFPDIYLKYHVVDSDNVSAGDDVSVQVTLKRYVERRRTEVGPVIAPRYPGTKEEGWWLVVGDTRNTTLLLMLKRQEAMAEDDS